MRINTGCWMNGCRRFDPDDEDGVEIKRDREWINLTVQEREKLRDEYEDNSSGLISAVQMMLKEKNGN